MFRRMAQRKTLLIVDDDADLRGAVAEQLQAEDFATIEAATAGEGVSLAQSLRPDLILLDVDLPDMDGRDACQRMRLVGVTAPVIMLTAKSMEEDKVQGLEQGADDYITKPFSPRELNARIKALIRRKTPEHSELEMSAGPLTVDPVSCRVSVHGQPVEMGHAEFKLLRFLIAHPERVFTRGQLLDKVWGDHAVLEERTVDVHVLRLRKALGDADAMIKTVRSVGYMLSEK
jgi:two-component system phosphate regulon response regulator PhoB